MDGLVTLIRTITPLHVGTGQSAGAIDLEIAREKATGWPVIPGTGIKGVLKDAAKWNKLAGGTPDAGFDEESDRKLAPIFGFTGRGATREETTAGALIVSDHRILLFPVRSFYGTFAYVTCGLAVRRFSEVLQLAGKPEIAVPSGTTIVGTNSAILNGDGDQVFLEDLDLAAAPGDLNSLVDILDTKAGLDRDSLQKHLCVVDETTFSFLCRYGTDVVTHVTLEFGTKTHKTGGLRVEESVPCEAVFYGLVHFQRTKTGDIEGAKRVIQDQDGKPLQFGGKASVGQGLSKLGVL